ncbi:hypothetical protein H8959_007937, partial [Pygathrix nigripes]
LSAQTPGKPPRLLWSLFQASSVVQWLRLLLCSRGTKRCRSLLASPCTALTTHPCEEGAVPEDAKRLSPSSMEFGKVTAIR